jgi:hypothetical protein
MELLTLIVVVLIFGAPIVFGGQNDPYRAV